MRLLHQSSQSRALGDCRDHAGVPHSSKIWARRLDDAAPKKIKRRRERNRMTAKSKPMRLRGWSVALLLLLTLPNAKAQREDVRAAIEAGNNNFTAALSRADAAGLAALYTTNAQVFPAHSDIVRGKQAIEQFWKGVIDSGVKGAVLKTLEVE